MSSKNKSKEKESSPYQLTESQLRILTAATAAAYFIYSFFSDGFYQHDEIAHYLNMLDFWGKPEVILGNWAKPGYKILFVLFALGGSQLLLIANCLVTALACYVAYKVAERLDVGSPLIAFFLLASQPMWIQLSFRTYSEPISALLLITAVYFHIREKTNIVALLFSFGTTIRQEFIVIMGLYGIFLLIRRQWIAVALLLVFPLINNIAGYFATGDLFYLYTNTVKTGASYESSYPKQGFDHYFLMAPAVFGLLSLSTLALYFSLLIFKVRKPLYALEIPAAVYFLLHCLFNTKSISVGASTGGNLRYMIVIAPVIAVLGSIAVTEIINSKQRQRFWYVLIPFLAAIGIWTTYQHNNVVLVPDMRDMTPLVLGIIAVAGLFLFRNQQSMVKFIAVGGLAFAFFSVKPLKISAEDSQIKLAVQWAKENNIEQQQVLANHVVFFYFYGKSSVLFAHGSKSIDSTTAAEAPIGSYIIWDSHYSYRPEWNPKMVGYEYFLSKPKEFTPVKDFITPDRRFGIIIFRKVAS